MEYKVMTKVMTNKERLGKDIKKIFRLFKGQELTPDIPDKIEKAIRNSGSIIALTDIEDAINFFMKNGYIHADVRAEGRGNKKVWKARYFFRKTKPRNKSKKNSETKGA